MVARAIGLWPIRTARAAIAYAAHPFVGESSQKKKPRILRGFE